MHILWNNSPYYHTVFEVTWCQQITSSQCPIVAPFFFFFKLILFKTWIWPFHQAIFIILQVIYEPLLPKLGEKEATSLSTVKAGYVANWGKRIYLTAYYDKRKSCYRFCATLHIPLVCKASKMRQDIGKLQSCKKLFTFSYLYPQNWMKYDNFDYFVVILGNFRDKTCIFGVENSFIPSI